MKNLTPKQPQPGGIVMVCITRQRSCQRLIERGAQLAADHGLTLEVVHVVNPGENFLGNPQEGEALDFLFSLGKQYNAEVAMLRNENVLDTLIGYGVERNVQWILLGQPKSLSRRFTNITKEFSMRIPNAQVEVVG